MMELWNELLTFFSSEKLLGITRMILLLLIGYALAKLVSSSLVKMMSKRSDLHQVMLVKRGSYYLILSIFAISALHQLGFDLSVLLGAAGILSVALGFASQTSASNLISGLFLMAERPFSVGDVIRAGTTTGEVLSIDLLSVKLRTFDNLFVRIPNETLIKSDVTTLTRFPIRRIDLLIRVSFKENLKRVRKVLDAVADNNPLCLEEPKPVYIFKGFGESSMDIQYCVWAKKENYLDLKNQIYEDIMHAFEEAEIEIPYPHRTFYTENPFSVPFAAKQAPEGLEKTNNTETND
ncbi:MAG: mechanosensitive ion channel family protein [Gammaproteobacteria bacterium]|nr:mechanosensitive ion channel family protein [Gammaproteobacteria bacterium]